MCLVSRGWWRATIEQSTYFFSFFSPLLFLRLLSLLFYSFVLSMQQQQQPLWAIHRMVCQRIRCRASTKLFEKISLVALCICPFDDDTYHLSLAQIFSYKCLSNETKCKKKIHSESLSLHASVLRLFLQAIWSMWHNDCAVDSIAVLCETSIMDEQIKKNIS